MLSVVCYGRNDDHGYNYHKRLAISFNSIAALLTHEHDEILFVDYNTPDELPTLPEAIQDILTPQAREKLRIFRVRPAQHAKFSAYTRLPVIEPIARNIAVRRSSPQNRWILSTNSDMIFVPREENRSLSDIVASLPDGFYALARFELPEYWWESTLDRLDPVDTIHLLRQQAKQFHFDLVASREPYLRYDNPGDFQLMSREAIFDIQGFDESMLLGWHVDSNLSRRFFLHFKEIKSLTGELTSYHCNHVRKLNDFHSEFGLRNNWKHFVSDVKTPYLPAQRESWGLIQENIEEIRLIPRDQQAYHQALKKVLFNIPPLSYEMDLANRPYNDHFYASAHFFPYLTDHLVTLPNDVNIAYLGVNETLLTLLSAFWREMGYVGKIFCLRTHVAQKNNETIHYVDQQTLLEKTFLCVADFGVDESLRNKKDETHIRQTLNQLIKPFVSLAKKASSRYRFLGVNLVGTDFKFIFTKYISASVVSYNCNVLAGFVKQKKRSSRYIRFKTYCRTWRQKIKTKVIYHLCYFFPMLSFKMIRKLGRLSKKIT